MIRRYDDFATLTRSLAAISASRPPVPAPVPVGRWSA